MEVADLDHAVGRIDAEVRPNTHGNSPLSQGRPHPQLFPQRERGVLVDDCEEEGVFACRRPFSPGAVGRLVVEGSDGQVGPHAPGSVIGIRGEEVVRMAPGIQRFETARAPSQGDASGSGPSRPSRHVEPDGLSIPGR